MNEKETLELDIESLKIAALRPENVGRVHEMCEKSADHLSHSLQAFQNTTIESELFEEELSLVASTKEGEVVAFFLMVLREPYVFKRWRRVAVLKFFVVKKKWRQKGLGTRMLNSLLEKIRISEDHCFKMKCEVMSSMPDYWCPGLDPRHTEAFFFLKKHGFKKKGERINLCVDLTQLPENKPPSQHQGVTFSRAEPSDEEELVPMRFMQRRYQLSFWPQEVALSFDDDPITSFVAKEPEGQILGWASHSAHFPGSFGPTGVSKKAQGKGIGSILLHWCLWDLKQAGLETARIMWVGENTAYFYLKSIGAHICEFFWVMNTRI